MRVILHLTIINNNINNMERLYRIFFAGVPLTIGVLGMQLGVNPGWESIFGIIISMPVLAPAAKFWMDAYDEWFGSDKKL